MSRRGTSQGHVRSGRPALGIIRGLKNSSAHARLAVAALSLILVGACAAPGSAGSSPGSVSSPSSSTPSSSTASTSAVTSTTGEQASANVEPFDQYLRPADTESSYRKLETEREQSIVSCMAAAGFEYLPFIDSSFDITDEAIAEHATRAWVEVHGYGTTEVGAVAVTPTVDPNNKRLATLTAQEREQYWAALEGPVPAEDPQEHDVRSIPEEGASPPTAEPDPIEAEHTERRLRQALGSQDADAEPSAGCRTIATERFDQQMAARQSPSADDYKKFDGLMDEVDKVYGAAENAPELAALVQDWQGCMSDAGYPDFTVPSDARDSIFRKWAALSGMDLPEGRIPHQMMFATLVDQPSKEMNTLHAEELALALADFDCQVPYREPAAAVLREYEAKFVAEHRAELEAYRALSAH